MNRIIEKPIQIKTLEAKPEQITHTQKQTENTLNVNKIPDFQFQEYIRI